MINIKDYNFVFA